MTSGPSPDFSSVPSGSLSPMLPSVHQAWQQDRERAATVAEGDAQLRVARGDAAGDHRGRRERDVARKAQRLLGEGADDPVLPCGAQRVHEDRRPRLFGRSEERLEARIADRHAVHAAGDLDASEVEGVFYVFQFKNCTSQ